jgi:jumonji domain-containing protein 2
LQSIFPELHKGCHAFMRHKDILLSPGLLRTYGIEYMQVRAGWSVVGGQ